MTIGHAREHEHAEGTVAPASLDFGPTNWNVPQTVTVTGVDDLRADGHASRTSYRSRGDNLGEVDVR